ncbi:carbonyl reductase family member 4-like [Tropilaelaps mercedesae]|uniref:3-ketoacyl-[acyl-carrier-protein] reductase beta subunit n=1 Tax=Tropilaelaps mercedesae TaxID=418985 RepID=A0A1V9XG29_9ACAR|nr:carbonyl reductase family member 4-like [Tropilaelaps mercedesae]
MAGILKPSCGVAVVFGGSRGIGAACARVLAQEGWKTVAVAKHSENLQWISEQAVNGKTLYGEVCDVSDDDSIKTTVKAIEDTHGPIHILVNSAGIMLNKLLVQSSNVEIQSVVTTNLLGTIYTSRAVLKHMLRRKAGSIVNVGSVIGRHGNAGQCVYAASKAALGGFTKSLAKEVASKNIRVNMVSPGLIATDMTSGVNFSAIKPKITMGRIGQADEVARVIHFLATKASYMTGQDVPVCGGLTMRM